MIESAHLTCEKMIIRQTATWDGWPRHCRLRVLERAARSYSWPLRAANAAHCRAEASMESWGMALPELVAARNDSAAFLLIETGS